MKAILVIDKPDSCEECLLRSYSNLELVCTPMRKGATDVECPLRPLPQKLKLRIQREWITDYDRYEIGYNACLDEITGETE